MTERIPSVTTQSAISNNALCISSMNDAPIVFESADEEPYTIKCICDFSDDDGNTIYCEKCDTWQHIECFYPGRVDDASREDFDHLCADCKPRPLDRRHATERQKIQRQNKSSNYIGDKKIKRPPSKGHKKKTKLLDTQRNGFYDQDLLRNGLYEHHSFIKKPKGNRSSLSINSQSKNSPPYNSRTETNTQPPSPVQTPPLLPINFQTQIYSDNILSLYNHGPVHSTSSNSFASLSVSNSMTDWLRDPSRLFQDAGVEDKEDVFLNLKVEVDTLQWPELRIERKEEIFHNKILHRHYLINTRQLPPGRIVELNGLIGFQKDYCNDPENRWIETAHPRPFVFFHPRLPLCIDTRREGSDGRYVRRSCRSNTILETFIANGTDYYFWLTSEQPLGVNEQVTIPWDFRFPSQYRARFLYLLNLSDEDGSPFHSSGITHEEYNQLSQTINLVLSEHGGCACNLGHDCAFARFHRNYIWSTHSQNNENKLKKIRKSKPPQTSPTIIETPLTVRTFSESKQENHDEEENQSSAGSMRSKTQSRDMTPAAINGDTNHFSIEPSDREKRKLAMLEDSFRKMEQGQPARKKKRASENNSAHSPSTQTVTKSRQRSSITSALPMMKTPVSNNSNSRPRQLEISSPKKHQGFTSRVTTPSESIPPSLSAISPHETSNSQVEKCILSQNPQYKDSFTQTDEIRNAWWKEPNKIRKKSTLGLGKRLLLNRYGKDLVNQQRTGGSSIHSRNQSIITLKIPQRALDVQFQEIKLSSGLSSPDKSNSSPNDISTTVDMNFHNSPLQATHYPSLTNSPQSLSNSTSTATSKLENPPIDMSFDTKPPLLTTMFSSNDPGKFDFNFTSRLNQSGPIQTTSNNTNNTQQSFVNSTTQNPSPIKTTKKLSLSDYKAARMKKTDLSTLVPKPLIGEKISESNHTAVKSSSLVIVHETKSSAKLKASAKEDYSPLDQPSFSATM